MDKVIFTKYSNQRRKEYKIATSIIDRGGTRYVDKWALCREGSSHVQKMTVFKDELRSLYSESDFLVAECSVIDDNTIEMEYISGETLESIINECILNKQLDDMLAHIKEFSSKIYSNSNLKAFVDNENFRNLFGDVNLSSQLQAFDISNVDMIFSNFIYNDQSLYIIDFEWFFDFQIPIEFIMFRSLFHNALFQSLNKSVKDNVYELLGISKNDITAFKEMEYSFQKYIKGDNYSFAEIYEEIGQELKVLNKEGIVSDFIKYSLYIGEEKIINSSTGQADVNISVSICGCCDNIILYLNNKNGIYKIRRAIGIAGEKQENLTIVNNNYELEIIDDYYFIDDNPMIVYDNKGYDSVNIEYSVIEPDNKLLPNLVEALKREKDKMDKLLLHENELDFYSKIGVNNLYKIGVKLKGVSKK